MKAKYSPIQVGNKFGYWIVLEKAQPRGRNQYWRCRCLCGTEKEVADGHLKLNKSKCINCAHSELRDKSKYLSIKAGNNYGYWTVLEKTSRKHNLQYWLVQCKCGTKKEVNQNHLQSGKSTKCIKCSGLESSKKRDPRIYRPGRRSLVSQRSTNSLYEKQNGICPLCGKLISSVKVSVWDHDHKTLKGRELLHRGCNVVLGFLENNPEMLQRCHEYCKKYGINQQYNGSFCSETWTNPTQ